MKNYIISGSLGNISKPIVTGLVKAGKAVTVITSKAENEKQIEAVGAKALVGSLYDAAFLRRAFQGADVAYTMIPPIWQTKNWRASQHEIAVNYAEAINSNKVQYVVNLSSLGAHLPEGNGPVGGLHEFEKLLNQIEGLHVKHLRPAFFYNNLISQIGLIRQAGIMGANYGGEDQKLMLVHTKDIAAVALEELLTLTFSGNSARYIISDIRSADQITGVLGKVIDKEIRWVVFTDEQQKQGLLQAGISETHAQGFTEMGAAFRSGKMQEEAIHHSIIPGSVKLEDFGKEFSAAYKA